MRNAARPAGFWPPGRSSAPGYFVYDNSRLYGFSKSGWPPAAYLRKQTPRLLPISNEVRTLSLDLGNHTGPESVQEGFLKESSSLPAKLFNPSIVAAPPNLCPRCAFVAAVRADVLHQCDRLSPIFRKWPNRMSVTAFFKHRSASTTHAAPAVAPPTIHRRTSIYARFSKLILLIGPPSCP